MSEAVSAWMSPYPVCVLAHAPLPTCAALMVLHRFRHLPVLDVDGRVVGLIDDAVVFGRGELEEGSWHPHDDRDRNLKVSDLLTPDPVAMGPARPAAAALEAMVQTGQDAVVIVDEQKRPVGILTAHDGVRHALTVLPETWTTEDVASADVITVQVQQGVGAALDTMKAHGLRHVVVLRGKRPVGVASWRTLVELDASRRRGLPLDEVTGGAVETVRQGAPLLEVLEKMVAQKVGCLPVVDGAKTLTGLISRSDILHAAAARL